MKYYSKISTLINEYFYVLDNVILYSSEEVNDYIWCVW